MTKDDKPKVRLHYTGGEETPEIRAYLDKIEVELNARGVAQLAMDHATLVTIFRHSVFDAGETSDERNT